MGIGQSIMGMKKIVMIAAFLLGVSTNSWSQTRIAFVAGVERYNKSGLKNLEYAEDDAKQIKTELENLGFETFAVIGDDATLKKLTTELDAFITATKALNKSDIAIVYFSGHGVQKLVPREKGDGTTIEVEEPFFCPNDAIKKDVSTLLSLNTLLERLEDSSGSDHNIIMLDACRDSADKNGKGGIDGSTIHELSDKLALFFAAKSGHRSFENPEIKHGIFTYYLLEGLQGKAADRDDEITFQGLANYVSKQVERNSPALLQVSAADAQKPNLMGNLTGTVVLGKLQKPARFADESDVLRTDRPFEIVTTGSQLNWVADVNGEYHWESLSPINRNEWEIVMQGEGYTFDFFQNQKNNHDYIREYCRKLTLLEMKAGRLPFGWEFNVNWGRGFLTVVLEKRFDYPRFHYPTKTRNEWQIVFAAALHKIENDASLDPEIAFHFLSAILSDTYEPNELSQVKSAAIQRLVKNGFFKRDEAADEIYQTGIMSIGSDVTTLENVVKLCENSLSKTDNQIGNQGKLNEAVRTVQLGVLDTLWQNEKQSFPNPLDPRMLALKRSLQAKFPSLRDTNLEDRFKGTFASSKFNGKFASIKGKFATGNVSQQAAFQGKVVVAYHCCEPCGIGYHTYARANDLYEKWQNYPVEFVICCPSNEDFQDDFLEYLRQSMPQWRFASISVDGKDYGTDAVPGLTVIDKKSKIRFQTSGGESPHILSFDPFVDKLIKTLLDE